MCLYTKLQIYNTEKKPYVYYPQTIDVQTNYSSYSMTYGIQLWGSAKVSNLKIVQVFQSVN